MAFYKTYLVLRTDFRVSRGEANANEDDFIALSASVSDGGVASLNVGLNSILIVRE